MVTWHGVLEASFYMDYLRSEYVQIYTYALMLQEGNSQGRRKKISKEGCVCGGGGGV